MLMSIFAVLCIGHGIGILIMGIKRAKRFHNSSWVIAGVIVGGFLLLGGTGIAGVLLHYLWKFF